MSNSEPNGERQSAWSKGSLAFVVGLLIVISLTIVLSTAPFAGLLGPSAFALAGALHGMVAFILMIVATISLYLAWRLFMGRLEAVHDLQLATTVVATFTFLTIVFGNWIYIPYRAKTPDSPRTFFMETMPEVHKVFFEFKEFAALFTLPLSIAAVFIIWRYGQQLIERNWLRTAVAVLVALHYFYFVLAFGLGAAVTKLRSI